MLKYNTHLHSNNSHDGKYSVDDMCHASIEAGFSGIAVTDHCELRVFEKYRVFERITGSIRDAAAAREKFAGKLEVAVGVEFSDPQYEQENNKKMLSLTDYDIVVGSLHAPKRCGIPTFVHYPWDKENMQFIDSFMHGYFAEILDLVTNYRIDVLAHLPRPLRYLNHIYNFDIRLEPESSEIDMVLRRMADLGVALEVNLIDLETEYGRTMKMSDIAARYRELGGVYVTIGNDAHIVEKIDSNFESGAVALRDAGFDNYYYYKERKPIPVSLK